MRRTALIFGMLLTLTAGVWTSALAAAAVWCAPADAVVASDEHDCCIAKVGKSNAHHAESQEIQHEATHEPATKQVAAMHEGSTTQTQTPAPHGETNCDGASDPARETHEAALSVEGGLSCFECCAGGSGQTPVTAIVVAPEQTKVKRDAANATAHMRQLFAPASLDISHLAPSQHAPPHKEQRRHILISVFLI